MIDDQAANVTWSDGHFVHPRAVAPAAKHRCDDFQGAGAGKPVQRAVRRCQYRSAGAFRGDRSGEVADDVGDAPDLGAGQEAVLGGDEYRFGLTDKRTFRESAREMHLLPEHIGRHEGDTAIRDPETASAILVLVHADDGAGGQFAPAVDDRP